MSANKDDVLLLDLWVSPFGMRVRIALSEKGVEYKNMEMDLRNKSELLLKSNPIHKKVPVLLHNNKPICESSIIVQYIDEVWRNVDGSPPLLPTDPYERAQARFWNDYIDKKVYESGRKIYTTKGEDRESAKKEFLEVLKQLEESVLGDKPYFGGTQFGYLDLVLIPFYSWFYMYETIGGFKIEDSCPKIIAWAKRCMENKESVAKALPDPHKVYEFINDWYKP